MQAVKARAEYPLRLVAALEGATAEGWDVSFLRGQDAHSHMHSIERVVRVKVSGVGGYEVLDMPSLPPEDGYECELPVLEGHLREAKEHREREARRERLRQEARAKADRRGGGGPGPLSRVAGTMRCRGRRRYPGWSSRTRPSTPACAWAAHTSCPTSAACAAASTSSGPTTRHRPQPRPRPTRRSSADPRSPACLPVRPLPRRARRRAAGATAAARRARR